jgi:hypothetical protein
MEATNLKVQGSPAQGSRKDQEFKIQPQHWAGFDPWMLSFDPSLDF